MKVAAQASGRLGRDFTRFWVGQTVSNLGSSITLFALPLLVYELTGSAINLALTTAAQFIPHLLFGLVIGAYVDRLDRKRLMIGVDLLRALVISTIPLMAAFDALTVWWIYGTGFVMSTLTIFFDSSQFAAIPSLVAAKDLVTANGRIQASFSAAQIAGPLLAGLLVSTLPPSGVVLVDASTFLVSALSLGLISKRFNLRAEERRTPSTLRNDVMEGLRYVMRHPILRDISLMLAVANLLAATIYSQIVLFADVQLGASRSETAFIYAAGALGMTIFGLMAGRIRKRWSFTMVAKWALILESALFVVLGVMTSPWLAMIVFGLMQGLAILFIVQTSSLRQLITPNHMLGRIMTVSAVLAWSAIPLGSYLGGLAIEATGRPDLVYMSLGVASLLVPVFFFTFTELRRAEKHIPQPELRAEQQDIELERNPLTAI
ncbi:MAG: MFS transporter [Actinomycetota bacterium]